MARKFPRVSLEGGLHAGNALDICHEAACRDPGDLEILLGHINISSLTIPHQLEVAFLQRIGKTERGFTWQR